jgi:alkanesulfonate monooxygenase SsuD/methylene tetrahydromethanopterin reductase-like flavin-dependent oxidoreductase (luciferase family)
MISDHLQPWVPRQGHAGHVWTTLGAIAQAADVLEVGTGVDGEWPRPGARRRALAEAIDVIRRLWDGEELNHDGSRWHVEHLELWERPAAPPPLYVAAGGRRSAALAGRSGAA